MGNIKDILPSNDSFYPWASKVYDNIKKNNPITGTGFLGSTYTGGSKLSLHPKYKYNPNYMNYVGEWNITSSYGVNDVVRVLPNKVYSLPWVGTPQITTIHGVPPYYGVPDGTPTITGTLNINELELDYFQLNYVPVPGTYVCVSNVPSFSFFISLLQSLGFADYAGALFAGSDITSNPPPPFLVSYFNYLLFGNINYYPVWPELTRLPVSDPSNPLLKWGRYWELISLLPTVQNDCINGVSTSQFVDAEPFPSGSANWLGVTNGY